MKKQPLYLSLAVLRQRHYNLNRKPNQTESVLAMINAVEDELSRLMREHMPSGSGFDNGVIFITDDHDKALKPVLRFTTSFHHMDEQGGYDGWTHHGVKAEADFHGLRIGVTGSNRNDIKDYIGEAFYTALMAEVEAWPDILKAGERPLPDLIPAKHRVELENKAVLGYHDANPSDSLYLVRSPSGEASLVLDSCEFHAHQTFISCFTEADTKLTCELVGKLVNDRPDPFPAVLKALEHVRDYFPYVTHVVYDAQGKWFYFDDDHEGPHFNILIDIGILEDAQRAVERAGALPSVYFLPLPKEDE